MVNMGGTDPRASWGRRDRRKVQKFGQIMQIFLEGLPIICAKIKIIIMKTFGTIFDYSPVHIKNNGIRGRSAVEEDARDESNVPNSNWIQLACRQMVEDLIDAQSEQIANDVDGQNDHQ
jgi:hypothetical protein